MRSNFDKIKGYSFDASIKIDVVERKIRNTLIILYKYLSEDKLKDILVAGCGKGEEAVGFYNLTNANVYGIDLNVEPIVSLDSNRRFCLTMGDLNRINHDESRFDFIYCYHVLEHVKDPLIILKELNRVLKPSGVILIGFPNRNRLLPSYFTSHLKIPFCKIILYNLLDYSKRITGKFKNEHGAHAGFTENEFNKLACGIFNIFSVRSQWIELNYEKYIKIFSILNYLSLDDYIYPSNYFILKKKNYET